MRRLNALSWHMHGSCLHGGYLHGSYLHGCYLIYLAHVPHAS